MRHHHPDPDLLYRTLAAARILLRLRHTGTYPADGARVSRRAFAKAAGVSPTTVSRWLEGVTVPAEDRLLRLATYLRGVADSPLQLLNTNGCWP